MPDSKLTDRQKLILLVALVATLGIVLAINWAARRRADLYGPQAIEQASDGRVWLLLNHELQILDANGRSIRRISAKSLGIAPPVAALAPVAAGAVIIGSRETGLLHVVDANGVPRATIDPAAGGNRRLFGAFHLLPLPGTEDLVVSDTSNHRLLRLARDGRAVRTYGSADGQAGELNFPNGLALDEAGSILLVDTNHHSVRAFTPMLEPISDSRFTAEADRGYIWPALIGVAPDATRFVSIMANGMERGRVFKLSRAGERLAELALPASADPSGLLVRSTDVLVSDQLGLEVRRYGLDGSYLGTFGDASLQAALGEIGRLRKLYRATIAGGQGMLVVVLAGLLLLLRQERRAQERVGAGLAVQVAEYAKPGFLRFSSYAFWLALRISFVLLALNVIANAALWQLSGRRFEPIALATDAVALLLLVVAPSALGVWHFDRTLRAGKYSGILHFAAQTLLRRLGAQVQGVLHPDERIEQLALCSGAFRPARILVLTPQRFLVVTLRSSLRQIARVQEILRVTVSHASSRVPDVGYLRRLVGKLSSASLEIEIAGAARHAFSVMDPAAAREMAEALSSTAKGAGAGVAHLRDIPLDAASAGAGDGAAVPLLLSALVPGAGQLRQGRLAVGTIMLLCAATWIMQMMGPLIAIARKTTEVDPLLPVVAGAGYLVILAVGLLDTYVAARVERAR